MQKIEKENVVHYGTMHGKWEDKDETVLKLDAIKERRPAYANADLATHSQLGALILLTVP